MNNTSTTNAAETISTIGKAYGRDGRIATAKEMALAADVIGSPKETGLMVERKTGQAWKWSDGFNVWVTMNGWTGTVKRVRGKWQAFA